MAPAQFQGSAGRVRDFQGIGPELVADPGGIGGVDLGMLYAELLQPAQKRLEQARPEPALIDQAVEPAALAAISSPHRQALGNACSRPVVASQLSHFLCDQGQFVAALVVQGLCTGIVRGKLGSMVKTAILEKAPGDASAAQCARGLNDSSTDPIGVQVERQDPPGHWE